MCLHETATLWAAIPGAVGEIAKSLIQPCHACKESVEAACFSSFPLSFFIITSPSLPRFASCWLVLQSSSVSSESVAVLRVPVDAKALG